MSKFNELSVEERIDAIITAAENSGWGKDGTRPPITLKQATQIEQKNQQLVLQGLKQQQDYSRNNHNSSRSKAEQIDSAYAQREYQLYQQNKN